MNRKQLLDMQRGFAEIHLFELGEKRKAMPATRMQQIDAIWSIARELGIVLAQRATSGQREDLIATRIGQHRARPVHEPMNTAEFLEDLKAGPQQKMVGVGQQNLSTALEEIFPALRADGGMRPHGHEGGCQHLVVLCGEARGAGARIFGRGFEREMQPPCGGGCHFTASLADDITLLA